MMPMALILMLAALGALVGAVGLTTYRYTRQKARGLLAMPRGLRQNDAANLDTMGTLALTVVGVIIAAVVSLTLLANLFPTYSGSVKNISSNVTTADWGDATANSIADVFGMVVSLLGVFAILGLIFLAYKLKKS